MNQEDVLREIMTIAIGHNPVPKHRQALRELYAKTRADNKFMVHLGPCIVACRDSHLLTDALVELRTRFIRECK